jgi:hypothetical protein
MPKSSCIDNWLVNLSSDTTRKQYSRWFMQFLAFSKSTPEKLILKADTKKGRREVDTLTKMFYEELLKQGYAKSSVVTILFSIRSFFVYNDCPLVE